MSSAHLQFTCKHYIHGDNEGKSGEITIPLSGVLGFLIKGKKLNSGFYQHTCMGTCGLKP